jgi:hypothetical protein
MAVAAGTSPSSLPQSSRGRLRQARHAAAADAADYQALQQRRTLPGRAVSPILPVGASAGMQGLEVVLVLLPTDVSGMGIEDQGMPLLLRLGFVATPSGRSPAGLGTAEDVSPGITGVAQDLEAP